MRDTDLQRHVIEELSFQPTIDASHLGVAAQSGVVTLTGQVASYTQKFIAERAAKKVYGVKAVANDIQVTVPNVSKKTDTDIATAAVRALEWDNLVPDDCVKVAVREGFLALEGTVEWQYQKDAAKRAVRNLAGVRGVTDTITVRPKVKSNEVKDKIEAAFRRNAEIDARRVDVVTKDGKVTLHGQVRSWAEREQAEKASWAAPGVSLVINELSIAP